MLVTLSLTDILLMILTVCVGAAAIYAIALMRRLNAILLDWKRAAGKFEEVLPQIQHFCATSEEAMRSVKGLADQGALVMTDAAEVASQIRDVAEEGLARLHGLMGVMDTASMLANSFKAGLAAMRCCNADSDGNLNPDNDSSKETDDEKRDL